MKHLRYKLLAIPLGLTLLALPLGAWALAQEACCPWRQMLWTGFEVLPVAVAGAVLAFVVGLLLRRRGLDR